MFLWSTLNATGLLTLFIHIYVVNMEVWNKYRKMCHMFKWLPLLAVMSMRLHSSIKCSSTQKMCHHSRDPIVYKDKMCHAMLGSLFSIHSVALHRASLISCILSFSLSCRSSTSCGLEWLLSKMSI
jgi:hypothetical protein